MASPPQAPRRATDEPDRRAERPRLFRVGSFPAGSASRIGRKRPSVLQSFNYAFEGVIHVLRTQRNMRIHFAIAAGVLVLAFAYDVSKLELIALLLAIAFVLIAEMVNTAVEATIDVATTSFDPLAKLAKDIAAGAVLIASAVAVGIGYLVFADRLGDPSYRLVTRVRDVPINLTLIALVLTIIVVIAVKAVSGRGTPLRGGLPSGHAALAFGGWMAITFIVADYRHRLLISTLAFVMALLVAQTRVESGIHSTAEVFYGALIGTLVSLVLFQTLT
jgi:diacylglycerol kinase (ATP)